MATHASAVEESAGRKRKRDDEEGAASRRSPSPTAPEKSSTPVATPPSEATSCQTGKGAENERGLLEPFLTQP